MNTTNPGNKKSLLGGWANAVKIHGIGSGGVPGVVFSYNELTLNQ